MCAVIVPVGVYVCGRTESVVYSGHQALCELLTLIGSFWSFGIAHVATSYSAAGRLLLSALFYSH